MQIVPKSTLTTGYSPAKRGWLRPSYDGLHAEDCGLQSQEDSGTPQCRILETWPFRSDPTYVEGRRQNLCMGITHITVRGARQHNLRNVSVSIPRNTLTVVTGLSGSGKSSLAFDTIYAEGQRRYVETLSAYARQFLDQMERPDVDAIDGLSPGDFD